MTHGLSLSELTCLSAIKRHTHKIQRVKERWLVRRAFDNAQDAVLVSKSFRDIGILMSAFQVSAFADYVTMS